MLIPKKTRAVIYESLFNEGVMVAQKDFNAPKHKTLDVPNLQVIKAMQSLKSRGYVREQFNWQWYYWFLTNEGIVYLREYLHLPAEIVPATLKKQALPAGRPSGRPERDEDRPRREDREGGYRKKVGAGEDFNPEFRGYGRGAAQSS